VKVVGVALAVLIVATSCGGSTPTAVSTTTTSSRAQSTVSAQVSDCAGTGSLQHVDAPFGAAGADAAVVYLPACYSSQSDRRFPVLYMLHGAGADASQWPDVGLTSTADALITNGQIPALIIVMPDGGVVMDDRLAGTLVDQLVPWADRTYRTIADPSQRAAGGISRGGRIALLAAATHPGVFAGIAGHSPAVGPGDDAIAARLGQAAGPIRLDVGSDDPLRAGVEHFATRITAAGGSADLVEAAGRHNRAYWRAHAIDYLRFYASLLT
jgi:enterochelin esterase-like enzyme